MMTAEEKRELLLKRVLPGLAVTVLYFVFVSGMMSEKMKKAEKEYKSLVSSGVSKDALPGVEGRQGETQRQLNEVQAKVAELQEQFKKMAGFLSSSGTSTNAAMARVTRILQACNINQSKDEKASFPESQLSPALKEVWQAIKPADAAAPTTPAKPPINPANTTTSSTATISVHHLWLKGGYKDMYRALTAIADPKLQVLPVSLTMKMPEVDTENSGEMEWELILWM